MLGIIIPTKNNTTDLFRCLRSIKKSTSIDYRVYVADTGSTDEIKEETKKVLGDLFNTSKFIEYDFYNFGKINNDVVKYHLDTDIDVLLFCNNDITIGVKGLIDATVNVLITNKDNIGTCGCRLLYPDNTIQHDGQFIGLSTKQDDALVMGHLNIRVPHNSVFNTTTIEVDGITFAFAVTLRSRFESLGMLSEDYIECFEDVQYNLECKTNGFQHILLPSMYWAYHHESKTRNNDKDHSRAMQVIDYGTIVDYVNTKYNGTLPRLP